MFLKSNFTRILSAFCLTLAVSVFAFGDTIRLKDGSIIKGKIVSFGDGRFTVLISDGNRRRQLNYLVSEVESISFDMDSTMTVKTAPSNNYPPPMEKDSTIITVGKINTPKSLPPPQNVPPKVNTAPPVTTPKPIEVGVKVLADNTANGWTNSGWVVKKGQKIKITGAGRVALGGGRYATPGGISSLPDTGKLMPKEATGGLIAVIGDNNNDFIFIGDSLEFTATKDGALFLGINEGNLDDNSGAFDIKIQISPEIGY